MKTEEIHQGWVRISSGKVAVTISPRGILHPSKVFHGEEKKMTACMVEAKHYINQNIKDYKLRGVSW